jgi:DNA-binding response OmpR family regulator
MSDARKVSILIIDDEPEVRLVLRHALESEGYLIEEASNKTDALQLFDDQKFDLITLDLRLGNENGLDLAREFRAKRNVPVIMITGKDAPPDRISGLEHGADDYIVKPFHVREVLLRIRNVLRRYEKSPSESDISLESHTTARRFAFDDHLLDARTRELKNDRGAQIDLTDLEFRLLTLLLANSGRVLSRREISLALNGRDWSPMDRTIDGHIARLRRKIEGDGDEPRMIKSVRNVGYVFAAEVTSE